MRTRARTRLPAAAAIAATLGACSPDPEQPLHGSTTDHVYSDMGGVGPFNGIEWQIDAPWRLEPTAAGKHDAIPLIVTIQDASHQPDRVDLPDDTLPMRRFCGLYVIDDGDAPTTAPMTFIAPSDFHEIEAERRWLDTGAPESGDGDFHQLRRLWAGDSPDGLLAVDDWADWNAVALYTPVRARTGGEDARLIVAAEVSTTGACSAPLTSNEQLLAQLADGRATRRTTPSGDHFILGDFLSVHHGEQPLPRFSAGGSTAICTITPRAPTTRERAHSAIAAPCRP